MEYNYYTERLNLHVAQPSEADIILDFHIRNSQYFAPYESAKATYFFTEHYQRRNISAESISFIDNSFIRYYIYPINCISRAIGTISFKNVKRSGETIVQIGYKIDHDEWQKGYAYEALHFIIPRARLCYGACPFEALVQPSNHDSISLLNKLGFSLSKENGNIICEANGKSMPHNIYQLL